MVAAPTSRSAFVLVGGKSSRMGVDKAFLDFRGQTLLERALGAVREVCERVTIIGDPARFEKYGQVVSDIFPGCGPLGGIHAGLAQSGTDLNLMLAVDMPFASGQLFAFLFSQAERSGAVATVPRIGNGLQPLCAVYHRDFAVPAAEALRAGKYKIDAAFSNISLRVIEESELKAAEFSEKNFFNMNTPQERVRADGGLA